ncbi:MULTISPECIES: ABC transporter permease subunit [Clostridium]|uniref:ABC transporter permease subunit n=1 Tax=Clostridium TaxID=1485 RepID=UPI00163D5532|nr:MULTISPECIES: ABC transporter permease subunit [Clostridium]
MKILNLFKLELYKLKKQKTLKVLLLLVILLSVLSAFSEIRILAEQGVSSSGKLSYEKAFQDIFMYFVCAVFAGLYIGADFSNRTIQSYLSSGHSRISIIIAKSLGFFMGTTIIMLLYPITVTIINTIKFGWGEPFTFLSFCYILRVALLGSILNIGTNSVFVLFAFIFKDIPKTICASLLFPILFSFFQSLIGDVIPILKSVINVTTLAQLKNISIATISYQQIFVIFLSFLIITIITLSLTYIIFDKAEIK